MKKEIWKFRLDTADVNDIKMPEGFKILSIQVQKISRPDIQCEIPCVWALVDPKAEIRNVIFDTYHTGDPIPDCIYENSSYTGTYQREGLVYHVFNTSTYEGE